jgi:hypothetical protein
LVASKKQKEKKVSFEFYQSRKSLLRKSSAEFPISFCLFPPPMSMYVCRYSWRALRAALLFLMPKQTLPCAAFMTEVLPNLNCWNARQKESFFLVDASTAADNFRA